MNKIFLVVNFRNGIGGHNFSALEIARLFQNDNSDNLLIEVGFNPSPILSSFNNYIFIEHDFKFWLIIKRIKEIFLLNSIHVIHSFDLSLYLIFRCFLDKVYLTKCGGPNYRFFKFSKNLSLFTLENYYYYNKKGKNLAFIPNRIKEYSSSLVLIDELKSIIRYNDSDIIFLSICRINAYYERNINIFLNLYKALCVESPACKFILLGEKNDDELVNYIHQFLSPNFYLVSDMKFTKNAKLVVDLCDFYFGSGRSLMEATYLNKVLLVPSNKNEIPVLLSHDNFMESFKYNFTERYISSSTDAIFLSRIQELLDSSFRFDFLSKFNSLSYFYDFFYINNAHQKYLNFYKSFIPESLFSKILGLFFAIIYYIYNLYRHKNR